MSDKFDLSPKGLYDDVSDSLRAHGIFHFPSFRKMDDVLLLRGGWRPVFLNVVYDAAGAEPLFALMAILYRSRCDFAPIGLVLTYDWKDEGLRFSIETRKKFVIEKIS